MGANTFLTMLIQVLPILAVLLIPTILVPIGLHNRKKAYTQRIRVKIRQEE